MKAKLPAYATLVRVWDLPTRLFHWSLALFLTALVLTGELGGSWMEWHFALGYCALTLVLFRIGWGFVGGYWSRFATFVCKPTTVRAYLHTKSPATPLPGHNPLGGYSVLAMLALTLLQALSGLASDDQVLLHGPLASQLDELWVHVATRLHTGVTKWSLMGLVLLHLGAIAWYRLRKGHDLVRAMLSGDAEAAPGTVASQDNAMSRLKAALLLAACAGALVGAGLWLA